MALPVYGMAVGSWLPYSETFIYDQVRQARRMKPWVLARSWNAGREAFPYENVTTLSLPELLLYYQTCITPRFRRALEIQEARLVHAHFGTNGALIAPTAQKLGLPLAVTFHGVDVGMLMGKSVPLSYRFYARTYRRMFETAQLLLPASQELADCLLALGAPAEKIRVHRLGVDLKAFVPRPRPERPARFLMVGRQVEKKGFAYGIRAFARVADLLPGSSLTLVGKGPLQEDLRRLAEELKVSGRVHFQGAVQSSRMPALLAEFDVLVAPCIVANNNDRDSGLLVLKEAGASAMPSIGTYCGGLPEIIEDSATGYLVEQHAVDTLAQAMEALAKDSSLRQRLGEAARAKMEKEYDTLLQNERLETLLESLL